MLQFCNFFRHSPRFEPLRASLPAATPLLLLIIFICLRACYACCPPLDCLARAGIPAGSGSYLRDVRTRPAGLPTRRPPPGRHHAPRPSTRCGPHAATKLHVGLLTHRRIPGAFQHVYFQAYFQAYPGVFPGVSRRIPGIFQRIPCVFQRIPCISRCSIRFVAGSNPTSHPRRALAAGYMRNWARLARRLARMHLHPPTYFTPLQSCVLRCMLSLCSPPACRDAHPRRQQVLRRRTCIV